MEIPLCREGAPVAQWVSAGPQIWQTEFDPRSRLNLLNHKQSSIAHSLTLSASHHPDMTEILLKRV